MALGPNDPDPTSENTPYGGVAHGWQDPQSIVPGGVGHEREEWEALHNTPEIITASMVPTILGVNPYESAFTLYYRLLGYIEPEDVSYQMERGHALEPLIRKWFRKDHDDRRLYDTGEYTVWTHPELYWLKATPDGVQVSDVRPNPGTVEIKDHGVFTEAADKYRADEIPLATSCQILIQMACMNLEWGTVAASIGGQPPTYGDVDRHDRLIKGILHELVVFYHRLGNGKGSKMLAEVNAPKIDSSEGTGDTIKALHPDDNNESIEMPDALAERAVKMARLKKNMKRRKDEVDEISNELRAFIGPNSFGVHKDLGVKFSLKTTETVKLADNYSMKSLPARCLQPNKYRSLRAVKVKGA